MPARHSHRSIPGVLATLLAVALLAGCGDNGAPVAATAAAPQTETLQIGDITIRANAMQTSALGEQVAAQYGIERDDQRVMLLVGVRQGAEALDVSVPARVTVTVTDLRGQPHAMPMRELRSNELVDYVGTVDVSLPDTLKFDISIVRAGGESSVMQFSREFYPR